MAVTSNTGAPTLPVVGAETDVAAIAPGTPLDNVTVYVIGGTGGGGGLLEYALYATVGGFRTRVAQKAIVGSAIGSIIDFDTGLGPLSGGAGDRAQTEQVDAGGTTYTVTVIDLSTTPAALSSPRTAVTVTIAGVDAFDTVPDQNFGATFVALGPGATGTLTTFNGYAQLMDVAIDQTNLPPVTVTVVADCGPGSVSATVISVNMTGKDATIASVFRGIRLPVATRYFVSVTNQSQGAITTTLTGVTYSVSITAGGVVVLNGDVIGPSNANTVIKWDNVPLLLAGLGNFGAPVDAAVPIFDLATGFWRNFALSGGATMTNAGVVTINPATTITLGGDVTGPSGANTVVKWENVPLNPATMGAPALNSVPQFDGVDWEAVAPGALVITLAGNANGPSNANHVEDFGIESVNTNVTAAQFVPIAAGEWYVGISGATADINVQLQDTFPSGAKVTVKDEDGSLAAFDFIVTGSTGKTIDGAASFTMNVATPGPKGATTFEKNFNAPNEWAVV
jgi:hypothetical protein